MTLLEERDCDEYKPEQLIPPIFNFAFNDAVSAQSPGAINIRPERKNHRLAGLLFFGFIPLIEIFSFRFDIEFFRISKLEYKRDI